MGRDLPSPSPQCLQIPKATYGGAASGEGEGGPSIPLWLGAPPALPCPVDAPWHPRWWARWAGVPIAFVGVSVLEPGEQGVPGRNVPAQCPPCWG